MYDTNIVMDINSGAVHLFDDIAYNLLDFYNDSNIDKEASLKAIGGKYSEDQINNAIDEIESLKKDGLLFSEDIYKEYLPLWDKKPVVKSLCLHIAHDCNLRCKYCFASTGDYEGNRTLMSSEVGKKAIDFLISQSQNRKNLEIDFFGGEPLMNFEVVKEIVDYARSIEEKFNKNFRFTITTNALLLDDEKLNYINENMGNLVLSIDGRKEINDNMRLTVNGKGCYDNILPKIKNAVDSRNQQNYYARGTFTRANLDFSKDVLHLADEGFEQISVEPVVTAKDSGLDIREQDLDTLYNEYEKLAYEYVKRRKEGKWFNFFHFMIDLGQGPCVAKRLNGCGSGHEYLAITPEGDIYPCHQFVGNKEFKMGNVFKEEINKDIQKAFKESNIYKKHECVDCWAKFYCSGGCAANAYQFNNDINSPYKIGCELEKKRVECAIWVKTQEVE